MEKLYLKCWWCEDVFFWVEHLREANLAINTYTEGPESETFSSQRLLSLNNHSIVHHIRGRKNSTIKNLYLNQNWHIAIPVKKKVKWFSCKKHNPKRNRYLPSPSECKNETSQALARRSLWCVSKPSSTESLENISLDGWIRTWRVQEVRLQIWKGATVDKS